MLRSRPKDSQNYLDFVPVRKIDHEVDDEGRVVLLRPKWMKGFFAKWLQPSIRHKYFRVRLDKFGAATWTAIDGVRTVGEIADVVYEQFGEEIEPRYERCSKFVHSLHEGAMVQFDDDQRDQ